MKNLNLIIVIILIGITSCEDINRNELKRFDSFSQMRSSILKIDSLIKFNNRKCSSQYEIIMKNDSIPLLRNPDTNMKFVTGSFCAKNNKYHSDLDSLASIMRRNYIISAVKYKGVYMYNFTRYNRNYDFNYTKYMVIDSMGTQDKLKDVYKILDVKEGIILAAPKRLESY